MSFLQAGTEICYLIYHIDLSYLEVPHHFKLKCIRFQSTEVDFQASIKNTVQTIEFFKRHLSSKKYYVKGSYLYLADPGFWNFYSKGTHYSVKRKPAIPWNWIVKVSWSSTHPKTQSSWPQRLPIYLQSAHTTQSLWVSYDNGKGKISGDLSFPTY